MSEAPPSSSRSGGPAGSPEPHLTEQIQVPEFPPLSEKSSVRWVLATVMTVLIFLLFAVVGYRYVTGCGEEDRRDFVHLFEILLVMYGTVLGFYFGTQD